VGAELTRYAVPGWGAGELWTGDGVVLAHDFDFGPVSDTSPKAVSSPCPLDMAERDPQNPGTPSQDGPSGWGAIGTISSPSVLDAKRCLTPFAPTPVAPFELVERFTSFLAGVDVSFDDVPLDRGDWTSFQSAVADVLRRIPRGEVVTYGELAALAGHPGAQRAVGSFCARNRFMILVPCHRVVAADGIGSYGSAGVAVKRRLLALEGVAL
jgi:O-6-methylguanine DNA methyltransferase